MKLRIKGNSLRLRLSRPEANAVSAGQRVEESTRFADGSILGYALQPADVAAPSARFANGLVEVQVPAAAAADWADSQQVALIDADGVRDGELTILIEKDFTCVEPRPGEDQSELFPNPKTSAA